jgi:hypothetical protein
MDTNEFTLFYYWQIKNFNKWYHYFVIINGRLTKREELSLRVVLALPKASRTGLVCTIWSSKLP